MASLAYNPYSSEEIESRFQELRAQQARAQQLFHSYSTYLEEEELEDGSEDPYLAYYEETVREDRG